MASHTCVPSQPHFASSDHRIYLCGVYFVRQYFENVAGNIHDVIGDENWSLLVQPLLQPHISCVIQYEPRYILDQGA